MAPLDDGGDEDDVVSVEDLDSPGGGEEHAQEDEGEEELEEALIPKGLRDPWMPSERERAEHDLTHQPPRPWCKHCVGGRSQHDQHRLVDRTDDDDEVSVPKVSLDYCFMGNSQTKAAHNPMLVAFDNRTGSIAAWQTYVKGAVESVATDVAQWISSLGY